MTKKLPKPSDIPNSFLTVKQAIKHFDISERTLRRDMASGKINPHKDKRGWNYFDPSDLSREYGVKKKTQTSDNIGQNSEMAEVDRPNDIPFFRDKISWLETQVKDLKEERNELKETLKNELDERQKLLNILENQTLQLEDKRESKRKEAEQQEKFLALMDTQTKILADQREKPPEPQSKNWLTIGLVAVNVVLLVAIVLKEFVF